MTERSSIQLVGSQRLTGMGIAGVTMLVLPACASVAMAFQQSSAWESYERTLRVNALLAQQGNATAVALVPTGLPITTWAVVGVISLVGAILLPVGRETVFSGVIER